MHGADSHSSDSGEKFPTAVSAECCFEGSSNSGSSRDDVNLVEESSNGKCETMSSETLAYERCDSSRGDVVVMNEGSDDSAESASQWGGMKYPDDANRPLSSGAIQIANGSLCEASARRRFKGSGSFSSSKNSEDLIEQARHKLMRLTTDVLPASAASVKSLSHPGTPPSPPRPDLPRKYSMGNQDLQRLQRHGRHSGSERKTWRRDAIDPVDLSVKRKRSAPEVSCLKTAFIDGDSDGNNSILRSALRGRSSTFTYGGRPPTDSFGKGSLMNSMLGGSGSQDCLLQQAGRQRVTLAKRNLNPVKARVLERLHAMVNFVLDLPEFNALPVNDQKVLLTSSAHRLLLLFMAEANMEFAVTTVHYDEDDQVSSETAVDSDGQSLLPKRRLEMPTGQFVDGIQNFITKCQSIGIRPSEYFFMKWIVLFHVGANRLERGDEVASLNTAARQDLQEIIADSHPTDKLRYSRLLLALHTVFGVNCGMLESLFCAPLNLAGGVETFVYQLLHTFQERDCAMTLGAMDL